MWGVERLEGGGGNWGGPPQFYALRQGAGRLSAPIQSVQDSTLSILRMLSVQGSSANRARASASLPACTTSTTCWPSTSPTGPPSGTLPSSLSRSMNAACSFQPACPRRPRRRALRRRAINGLHPLARVGWILAWRRRQSSHSVPSGRPARAPVQPIRAIVAWRATDQASDKAASRQLRPAGRTSAAERARGRTHVPPDARGIHQY
jgi:hypothetical protein